MMWISVVSFQTSINRICFGRTLFWMVETRFLGTIMKIPGIKFACAIPPRIVTHQRPGTISQPNVDKDYHLFQRYERAIAIGGDLYESYSSRDFYKHVPPYLIHSYENMVDPLPGNPQQLHHSRDSKFAEFCAQRCVTHRSVGFSYTKTSMRGEEINFVCRMRSKSIRLRKTPPIHKCSFLNPLQGNVAGFTNGIGNQRSISP